MAIISELISSGMEVVPSTVDTFAKVDVFEQLVNRMLPNDEFQCLHVTPRRHDLGGRKIEEAKDPDFQFRHRRYGHVFWIECRYRGTAYNEKAFWCNHEQLDHYQKFQKQVHPEKVYVVIGLGGWPKSPDHIYCIPLNEVKSTGLSLRKIRAFEHEGRSFQYTSGQLR